MGDILKEDFKARFEKEIAFQEKLVKLMGGSKPDLDKKRMWADLQSATKILKPLITDVLPIIWEGVEKNKQILGEAGQGVLLDLDRGTYPYVTSSHPGIAGFNLTTGLSPRIVTRTITVTKTYTTRVGEGPMPTELLDNDGEKIRTIGHEFGTTTGRPRRCGWLDIPAIRYGLMVGGADSVAMTKLDIFDSFKTIKICVSYKIKGKKYATMPSNDLSLIDSVSPQYETLSGWMSDTTKIIKFKDLPKEARNFINRVQRLIGKPIEVVSVGPAVSLAGSPTL
jgi:adenylosuccinate synthase